VRSVEWSGASEVDSPGSVPGPPQRQRLLSSARRARTSTTDSARSMDTVVRNRFRKFSTPRLLHFLFGNSLIIGFLDSQTFVINVVFSFVNSLSF